jgi:hypothetical protein
MGHDLPRTPSISVQWNRTFAVYGLPGWLIEELTLGELERLATNP